MNINLSLSPATSIINKIAVVIYKASAPNVPVDSEEFDPPHTNPRNITFADVDPTTYIVNTYETTGLPALGTLRHSFIYDPSYISVGIRPTEFLYMTEGETGYTDATWADWEIDSIERVGVGTQYPVADVNYFITGNGYRRDGFDLVDGDDEFSANEKFVIRFKPNITAGTPIINSSKLFTGVEVITEDTTIDETYRGKLLLVNSANVVVTLTFRPISILGSFDVWGIVNNGGTQVRCSIISESGTDLFQFNKSAVDEIILGQSEQLMMLSDPANGFIVMQSSSTILQAGQFLDAYDTDNEPNVLHCAGQLVSRDTYKRLWLAVQNMPAGTLVSEVTWNSIGDGSNNKGFFSTGNGTSTFRLPQIYSIGVMKAVNGVDRIPGEYEEDTVGQYNDTQGAHGDTPTEDTYSAGPYNFKEKVINPDGENLIKTSGAFKLVRI